MTKKTMGEGGRLEREGRIRMLGTGWFASILRQRLGLGVVCPWVIPLPGTLDHSHRVMLTCFWLWIALNVFVSCFKTLYLTFACLLVANACLLVFFSVPF